MTWNRLLATVLATLLVAPSLPALAQKKSSKTNSAAAGARTLPPINITEFRLPNGLRVVMHEDHSAPIVAVNLWYHVGSKNEVPGRTGFAHLFEHMMFQGSKNFDYDYFFPLQEAGGAINGSTNADRTNYYEVVPSNFLETALYLEADRMANLLDAMTEEKLANQRDVVKNEKRQNYDNRPYGLVGAKMAATMFPPDHPYHWLTIGSLDDLTAASMEDVKAFFRRFYVPNNASLVIAGDIKPADARRLVEKHFGSIPRGPEVLAVIAKPAALDREIRIDEYDRVALPRVYMAWHTVPAYAPDDAALDVLGVILANGKGSRLFKRLVYEQQIAQDTNASHQSREIAGAFQITATAKPGKAIGDIAKIVDEEVAKLKGAPPSQEEMERALNEIESSFIYDIQTILRKADQLNAYNTYRNQSNYFEQDLARYRKLTPADVQNAAQKYLIDKRVVLTVMPRSMQNEGVSGGPGTRGGGQAAQAARQGAPAPAPALKKSSRPDTSKLPKPGPEVTLRLPKLERSKLSNGLEVLVVQHHELPVVNMNLVVKTGGAADPDDRAGLANVTANMLDEGTRTRSTLDISNALVAIGANVNTNAGWDSSNASLLTLTRNLDRALDIYSDVVLNPTFPEAELKRINDQRLTAFKQRRDDANAIAGIVFPALLYGRNHPYGHPLTGDETSVAATAAADVRKFYETYYRPNNAALIVVGDVTPAQIMPKLEKAFGKWAQAPVPAVDVTAAPVARQRNTFYIVDRPGAAQSVIQIGHVGVSRSSQDYFPLVVLNRLLGGGFISRVNLNLREDKGYTYGARTAFDYRRGAGPFAASAGVYTRVTKESVAEFMKELRGVRGEIPITPEELLYAKQGFGRAVLSSGFETPSQIANRLEDIVLHGLPDDYFNSFGARIAAVTLEDVNRVARQHINPDRFAILVVGDRKEIEKGLRELQDVSSEVVFVDSEGRPTQGGSITGSR
jgi:zinc protease